MNKPTELALNIIFSPYFATQKHLNPHDWTRSYRRTNGEAPLAFDGQKMAQARATGTFQRTCMPLTCHRHIRGRTRATANRPKA